MTVDPQSKFTTADFRLQSGIVLPEVTIAYRLSTAIMRLAKVRRSAITDTK